MKDAAAAFRAAIAHQAKTQSQMQEVRLSSHSVCDFCGMGVPVWYYRAPEIGLDMLTGYAFLIDIDPHPAGGIFHRFDTGWLACDLCQPKIEDEDGEAVLDRWRANEKALRKMGYRGGSELAEARIRIGRVHKLFFEHRRGPERIHE